MKIVYLFDEFTGEYKGEYEAQRSPLEPDVYIAPVHSTDVQPLPFEQGKYNYFDGSQWTLKDDTRGVWFKPDHTTVEVDSLTELIDATWSRTIPPKTIAELKLEKLLEVNAEFNQSMLPIVNGVPDFERESWKKQEEEARTYQANNAATTPLLDSLAETRGIAKTELVTRIITKADLFATVSGQLIGKRQKLEDQINALPANATAADVAAIVW